MSMDLETLLHRCRKGDELAWEALVRRYQAQVMGLTRHYLHNEEDARDAAQDVFIRVYRRLETAPDADRFWPWLCRVTRNLSLDRIRRRRARPPAEDLLVDDAVALSSGDPTPEEAFESEDRRQLVRRAMDTLGELSREVLLLREISGLRESEVAAMLEVPVGTVKSRANRARVELARAVETLLGRDAPTSG
jgi:RNA polymerase sigma-70 factor (ECF subfamily)